MDDSLAAIPAGKREVLAEATEALRRVPNVVAIVLGGSYARGVAGESSDVDVGIYYREAAPFDVNGIRAAAESLAAPGTVPVVTELYGWGAWVNGGAWIQTPVTKLDFVYRNLDQLRGVIDEGLRGVWRHDYDQQPPYGFRSIVYFAETHHCLPLHDPNGEIRELKQMVSTYPEELKTRIIQDGLWGAEFSLWSCGSFAASGDVYNAAGCLTRAAQFLVHAIFSLNGEYFLNDKHANRMLARFPMAPRDCAERLAGILSRPGRNSTELRQSVESMRQLWADAITLTEGAYQPRFDLKAATSA